MAWNCVKSLADFDSGHKCSVCRFLLILNFDDDLIKFCEKCAGRVVRSKTILMLLRINPSEYF